MSPIPLNFETGCDYYNEIISSGLIDTQDIAKDTMDEKIFHGYKILI